MKTPLAQVLTVEHDAVIALDIQRLLREHGAEATPVRSGEEALLMVRQRPFDLIILNLRLRDMSGLEVCRRLKVDPDLKDTPVIFLSGETNPQFRDIAIRLGALDYLQKPYEPEDFKTRVFAHLRRPLAVEGDAAHGGAAIR